MHIIEHQNPISHMVRGIEVYSNDWEQTKKGVGLMTRNLNSCVVAAIHDQTTKNGLLGRFTLEADVTNRPLFEDFITEAKKTTTPKSTTVWIGATIGKIAVPKEIVATDVRDNIAQILKLITDTPILETRLPLPQSVESLVFDPQYGHIHYGTVSITK